ADSLQSTKTSNWNYFLIQLVSVPRQVYSTIQTSPEEETERQRNQNYTPIFVGLRRFGSSSLSPLPSSSSSPSSSNSTGHQKDKEFVVVVPSSVPVTGPTVSPTAYYSNRWLPSFPFWSWFPSSWSFFPYAFCDL